MREYLLSHQGQRGVYHIDKPASDQSAPLIAFAKDKFGTSVLQCGWQIQGHWDGTFNWCNKDFGLLAFGLNSMGAHYNPVTITIANSESRTTYQHSFS